MRFEVTENTKGVGWDLYVNEEYIDTFSGENFFDAISYKIKEYLKVRCSFYQPRKGVKK